MTAELASAVVLGLAGGLHCAGMCGPLVLAFGSRQHGWVRHAAYHAGRIAGYVLVGQLLGTLGLGLHLVGWQQGISIAAGLLMLYLLLVQLQTLSAPAPYRWVGRWVQRGFVLSAQVGRWQPLALGLLNGLLPCGLVYVAAAAALGTGQLAANAAFMLLFGLGTLPVLLGMGMLPGWRRLQPVLRMGSRWLPVAGLAVAVLLVVRGVGLPRSDKPSDQHAEPTGVAYRCPMCRH